MKQIIEKSYPHVIAVLIFVVLSTIYFSPQLKGYIIKQHDIDQHKGMSKEIVDFREKFHKEPLWTNATFGGMPAYQISVKNSNLINTAKDYILSVIPHPMGYIVFLMAGFYILLLCFNVKPWLAIIGSIAFGLASFNMIYLVAGHNAKVHAVSFIPPILGSIIYAYRKNIYVGAALLSIFTCLHLSANHVQMTYYLIFLIVAFVIVEFYNSYMEKTIQKFMRISAVLVIAGVLGVLPTISNLIVTNEYGKYTTRGKSELTITSDNQKVDENEALDSEYIKRYNMGKGETWSLVIPNVKGGKSGAIGQYKDIIQNVDARFRQNVAQSPSYWGEQYGSGGAFYYGAGMFLLFILGMFFVKDKIKWAVFSVFVLSMFLSWKNGIVIDFFIDKFPLFNKFRDSKMMLLIVAQITFPLMGILFLKSLINNEVNRKKFIYVTLGVSGLFILFYLMPATWFDFLNKEEISYFDEEMSKVRNNANYLQQYEDFQAEVVNARILIFKKDCLRSLFFILATASFLFLFMYKKIKETILLSGLGLLVLIDLWGIDKRYLNNEKKGSQYDYWVDAYKYLNPFQPTMADMSILNAELEENPSLNQVLEAEVANIDNDKHLKKAEINQEKSKIYFRELNFATNYKVLSLQNPFSSSRESYFHKSLGGYHGAKLRSINELIDFHISKEYSQLSYLVQKKVETALIQEFMKEGSPVLNMLNTKYIIYDLNSPPIMNPYHFGNAWFVEKVQIVKNADEEILGLASISKKIALIQERYNDKINTNIVPDTAGVIVMKEYRPNHLTYETHAQTEQMAVFSEIYYEAGWNAYIDGKKTNHVKANFLLRAMNIPAGDHVVEFKFEPESYYKSRKVSVAGSGLIVLFVSLALFLNWKKKSKED